MKGSGVVENPRGTKHAGEARRRADILRRYVAIDRPGAEVDAAFAAEVDLSVDTLVRLASAWRRHGEEMFLQGGNYRLSETDRLAALKALEKGVDLTEVPASHRAEVRRRLAAIRGYLKLAHPRAADLAEAAGAIGVTARQFKKLVRAWTFHRSAAAVPGAYSAKRPRRKNTARTDAITRCAVQALEELGQKARGEDVHVRVVQLCLAAGMAPPSLTTTYQRLQSLRERPHGAVSSPPRNDD